MIEIPLLLLVFVFALFRSFTFFILLCGTCLIVEQILRRACARKIVPGLDVGMFNILAEIAEHFSPECHIQVIHNALLPWPLCNLRGQTPYSTTAFHDKVGYFIRPGD